MKGQAALLKVGVAIIGFLVFVAIAAPLIAPHDPRDLSGDAIERPSADHLLGTNDVGQDIFSELVLGTRTSLAVAIPAAALGVAVALVVGAGAALRGGRTERVTMRFIDGLLAVPGLPVVVLVAAIVGPSRIATVLIIAMAAWPSIARVLHSQALPLRNRGYVRAARGFGAPTGYVLRRHLAPALAPTVVAAFVHWAATAVSLEAGLAFLGLGDPAGVSWGNILNRALDYQGLYNSDLWVWWVLPAGTAIALAAIGFAFIGVGLEPRFNPEWKRAG